MKINWDYIKFGLLTLFVGFLFAFSSQRNAQRFLVSKEVIFLEDDNHFISYPTVNKLLIQNNEEVTSIAKEILDLNEMEGRLNNNPMISKAEVFVTVDGVLGAKIIQRKPIARVAASTPFYIDEDGMEMPLSDEYAARVPIITGKTITNYISLKSLLLKLKEDNFLKNHIVGIHIEQDDELIFYLRVYDFKVEFGKPVNIDKKFQNFKAFYQKTLKDSTITDYSLVNLKLDNQVVGTKK
ncbi:MAG: cell division protein FtsQ/DivIB [Flavobacteriaceae bacterium]|nr:cell division protein FtsQ/DivIB [Flavobacteriaceae bacterium]